MIMNIKTIIPKKTIKFFTNISFVLAIGFISSNEGCSSDQDAFSSAVITDKEMIFTNQEQIDNFSIDYPDLASTDKMVVIKVSDAYDLSGLEQLTSVEGLVIENMNNLKSLKGLENLNYAGSIKISNCESLDDLSHISDITISEGHPSSPHFNRPEGDIYIKNIKASEFEFLRKVTEARDITLAFLPNISSLDWLKNLVKCVELNLVAMDNIHGLSGLESFEFSQSLHISGMNGLNSLDGLQNGVEINTKFTLHSSNSITNLNAINSWNLGAQDHRLYSLNIESNESLIDILALNQVDLASWLTITDNPLLECDQFDQFELWGYQVSNVKIKDNAVANCNSL